MQKTGKILLLVLIAVLFALGLICGITFSRWIGLASAPRSYSTPALLKQVQELSELVTVQYTISKVELLEVPSENIVGQMIGSQNRMLLVASGIVKAGIDFQRIKPEDLQIDQKRISIKLPPPQITDAYLDESETKVVDRSTGLLAPPAKDLEADTRRNALDSIRRAARTSGILSEADQRARGQLVRFLKLLGFETVEFR